MTDEPENLVLQMLRDIRADMATDFVTARVHTDSEFKTVRDQIAGVRRAVIDITRSWSDTACSYANWRRGSVGWSSI